MRVDGRRASFFAGLALVVAACGARTEPWSLGGGEGGRPTTGTGGSGGFGAGTGISTGVGAGGAGTGTGGTGTGGVGTGTGGAGTGGTSTGTGGAGTGTGGSSGVGGTGAGGSGTGGGAGRGGAGGGAGTGAGATGGRAGAADAGGSPPDAGLRCLGRTVQTSAVFEFYFLMEKSASMATIDMTTGVSRWAASERAINAFLSAGGPSRAAMGFFPQSAGSASCSAATYATPSVPFAYVWQNQTAFANAMQTQTLGGDAPTAPALAGALSYAAEFAKIPYPFYPETGGPSVILVTDGEPDTCSSTVDSTAAVAAAAFNATPRVKTFVIGVGGATERLDAIARAGGTSRAYAGVTPVSPLAAIRKSRVFCEIILPTDGDASTPVTRIHVQTNLPNLRFGDPLTFLRQVSSPSACGVEGGWFLDPPTALTHMMLCPDTCRTLADNEESRIVVFLDCGPPPNGL